MRPPELIAAALVNTCVYISRAPQQVSEASRFRRIPDAALCATLLKDAASKQHNSNTKKINLKTPCKISTIVNTTCFKNVKVFICFKKKCLVLVAYCFKKCLKCSVDFPVGEQMPELPPAHGHCNFVGKTWK